jgi:hypothetical protein
MLYPKENVAQRKLEFVCKLCPYKEININTSCVRLTEFVKDQSYAYPPLLCWYPFMIQCLGWA